MAPHCYCLLQSRPPKLANANGVVSGERHEYKTHECGRKNLCKVGGLVPPRPMSGVLDMLSDVSVTRKGNTVSSRRCNLRAWEPTRSSRPCQGRTRGRRQPVAALT